MDLPSDNSNKSKEKVRGRKRKRRISGDSIEYDEVLPDNALVTEKNLQASAVKNNLDEVSVRKIIRKVVTNDHVLALVKLREQEEDSGPEDHSPTKLTRAKVKELMKDSPKIAKKAKEAWNIDNLELTPIKHIPVKTRPEVKALIAQELPEDEDDDEYEPTNEDVPSDDDQGLCSDLESQPLTPATPKSLPAASPKVVKDGPFKVPQVDVTTPTRRKLDLEEEATIALRTRSKLSLSSTSIEHIESTFVPPDDLPMPYVDDLWNEFLNQCLDPAPTSKHEDDDEGDPEYNVAADPDANDEDEEALGNSIIKISKKELNDLVTELFYVMPETAMGDELITDNLTNSVLTDHNQAELEQISSRWKGKQESVSDEEPREKLSDRQTFDKRSYPRLSIGKSEPLNTPQQEKEEINRVEITEVNIAQCTSSTPPVVDIAIEERDEEAIADIERAPPLLRSCLEQQTKSHLVTIRVDDGVHVLPEQLLILQQQLRQHIQLATSNYLQLYVHPIHWNMAPVYKEYLDSFSQMVKANPKSVVNVCNLMPAVELVNMWEKSVSADTSENKEMVEFIYNEAERCRRRFKHKSLYSGEFHETFKKTVANSTVFLYPYLLPAMPYRAEHTKRYIYSRSEDSLIALGLDQFWDYVDKNPTIFKRRHVSNPRHRWGLSVTLQLVVKYMFPWIPYNVIRGHVQSVRKLHSHDHDNPINQFFETRTVTPVEHKLLAFNPKLTLYEQPEHEVPKIWVRYLGKTSKRFRHYLLRRTGVTGLPPRGTSIQISQFCTEPTKAPLPIDFTKEIISNRINLLPKVPKPMLSDKFDIEISPMTTTSLYQLVETTTGSFLMPLSRVTTVNSNTAPISSPVEVATVIKSNLPECSKSVNSNLNLKNNEHCSCCALLRKICKQRQTSIKDYFSKKSVKSCYCKDIKYPKVSRRLRLLVNNYKNCYKSTLQLIDEKLMRLRSNRNSKSRMDREPVGDQFDLDDFVFVTNFHLKLLSRTSAARDTQIKRRVNTIFKNFDPDNHDPVQLAIELYETFKVELVDLYKDFLCFLTPEQAERCGAFRDYFVRNYVHDLVKRVEAEVENEETRINILEKLHNLFYKNISSACEICTKLLSTMAQHPELARHVFSLFPHKKLTGSKKVISPEKRAQHIEEQTEHTKESEADNTVCSRSHPATEYEADHSLSEEERGNETNLSSDKDDVDDNTDNIKIEIYTSDNEMETDSVRNNKTDSILRQDSFDSSDISMRIIFEEESVKSEALEWKREEDKLILEILKEHLTPEQRKDKTIMERIEEKNIIDMIVESLSHKSKTDVTSRVLYLLRILVLSEN